MCTRAQALMCGLRRRAPTWSAGVPAALTRAAGRGLTRTCTHAHAGDAQKETFHGKNVMEAGLHLPLYHIRPTKHQRDVGQLMCSIYVLHKKERL